MFAIRKTFTGPPPPAEAWVLDGAKVATYPTAEASVECHDPQLTDEPNA